MPPPEDFSTTKLDTKSSIANYLNNISDDEYEDAKKRYKKKEPLSKSKSWEEFVRLAISRQYLEGRSGDPKAEVRAGQKVLLRTGKREKFLGLFDRPDDPRLTEAIANLDKIARKYAKEGSKAHKSESRHSHRETVEENAPSGHSKRGKTVLVESHHVHRRHKAGEQDEEPRRGAPLSIAAPPSQMHSNSAHGNDRRNGTATDYEYVYPPAPPIMVTTASRPSESRSQDHQQSPQRRESASRSGLGYSNRSSDRLSQRDDSDRQSVRDDCYEGHGHISGSHPKNRSGTQSSRQNLADGGSRAGRQERMSGVNREPTRSSRYTYSDENRASEATLDAPNWGSSRMSERGNSSGHGRSGRGP